MGKLIEVTILKKLIIILWLFILISITTANNCPTSQNHPNLMLISLGVIDSSPGGNGNNRPDPNETLRLTFKLKNLGDVTAESIFTILETQDTFIQIIDTITYFGDILPNQETEFFDPRITISSNVPIYWLANFTLKMVGRNYQDSTNFSFIIGDTVNCVIQSEPYWVYFNSCYTYPECPIYQWVELRNHGTRLEMGDDEIRHIPWPFGFRFYGIYYNNLLSICSNGFITPYPIVAAPYLNRPLPDPEDPNAMICINWDDLYPPQGGGIWYLFDSLNHRLIIEWDSVYYFSPRTIWDKFQIIIYDSTFTTLTGDNVFLFQYRTANAISGTIGIEDHTGTRGIMILPWQIVPGRAIKFTTNPPQVALSEEIANQISSIQLSSNPFTKILKIYLPGKRKAELEIFNLSGQRIKKISVSKGIACWQGDDEKGRNLPLGVYVIKLKGEKEISKIIKIK